MRAAYGELHRLGYAHSVETWHGQRTGRRPLRRIDRSDVFGESMFARSIRCIEGRLGHVLPTQLLRWHFELIDCQVMNPHLQSLGAVEMPRREFLAPAAQ